MRRKKYYQLWKDYEELTLQKHYNESYFDYSEEEFTKTKNALTRYLHIAEINMLISIESISREQKKIFPQY